MAGQDGESIGVVGTIKNEAPLFVDADQAFLLTTDLRLLTCSPALNLGRESLLATEEVDINRDGTTGGDIPVDFDIVDRVHGFEVDAGAFEMHVCCGDVDDDGETDFDDLLQVLSEWGSCSGACPFDVNGDDEVDFDDLLLVLTWWGCPDDGLDPASAYVESNSCLDTDDWDDFIDIMTDPEESEVVKGIWRCWTNHYLNACSPSCSQSPCNGADPYGNPCGGH